MILRTLEILQAKSEFMLSTFINSNNSLAITIKHSDDDAAAFAFDTEEDISEFIKELQKLKKELYGK